MSIQQKEEQHPMPDKFVASFLKRRRGCQHLPRPSLPSLIPCVCSGGFVPRQHAVLLDDTCTAVMQLAIKPMLSMSKHLADSGPCAAVRATTVVSQGIMTAAWRSERTPVSLEHDVESSKAAPARLQNVFPLQPGSYVASTRTCSQIQRCVLDSLIQIHPTVGQQN